MVTLLKQFKVYFSPLTLTVSYRYNTSVLCTCRLMCLNKNNSITFLLNFISLASQTDANVSSIRSSKTGDVGAHATFVHTGCKN